MVVKNDQKQKAENKETSKREVTDSSLNLGESCEIGPLTSQQRQKKAFQIRQNAAQFQKCLPLPSQQCNGDENLYPNKIANYSKALTHNELGEVNISAYNALTKALMTGNPGIFENIPLGGVVKLTNPKLLIHMIW